MRIIACIYVFVVWMRWIAGLGCPTLWIPAYAGMTGQGGFAGLGRCWGIVGWIAAFHPFPSGLRIKSAMT